VPGWKLIFPPDTRRLYVHPRLCLEGSLLPVGRASHGLQAVLERLALVGIRSFEPPFLTRVDVACDLSFHQELEALTLLRALYAAMKPHGWKTGVHGQPPETVYINSRSGRDKLARAYDKGRESGRWSPYRVIRLEAVQRFKPSDRVSAETAFQAPSYLRLVWKQRFLSLADARTTMVVPFNGVSWAENSS
jgi:hypothetical protein